MSSKIWIVAGSIAAAGILGYTGWSQRFLISSSLKKVVPGSSDSILPSAADTKKDGKLQSDVSNNEQEEAVRRSIADQQASVQQSQQTAMQSTIEIQKTLRSIEEINRINRVNQQMQQQMRK